MEIADQEASGPPWALMPLEEEEEEEGEGEHNIFTRQWKIMSARDH